MLKAINFFIRNLTNQQIGIFFVSIAINIISYALFLESDKYLIKNISHILTGVITINKSIDTLIYLLIWNLGYLSMYGISMFVIEIVGKMALKKAIDESSKTLLSVDLSTVTKEKYEHDVLSIVHHSDNVNSVIRNLFVEFPRKLIASWHFLIALKELSFSLMVYCLIANIVFVLLNMLISTVRKKLLNRLTELNVKFSIISTDLSNSIQSHKIDNRIEEYNSKIKDLSANIWINSSYDSLLVASSDMLTNFSGQFMVGFISYLCKPLLLSDKITLEDLMYGVRSSSKFIEKIAGIFEYVGDVVRQYKSFDFYENINKLLVDKIEAKKNIETVCLKVGNKNQNFVLNGSNGKFIRISGSNGVGKTTAMLKFLGVQYYGATSVCKMFATNSLIKLQPTSYRKSIAFVQQNNPVTSDTVAQYVKAVTGSSESILYLAEKTFEIFSPTYLQYIKEFLNNIDKNKTVRELSGGQSKFIQIIAAVMKLYICQSKLLIFDEPSNNLDSTKIKIVKDIINSAINHKVHVFIVTHDNRMIKNTEYTDINLDSN